MNPLNKVALLSILTEPKNALIKQYVKLFEMDDITLEFKKDALNYICLLYTSDAADDC